MVVLMDNPLWAHTTTVTCKGLLIMQHLASLVDSSPGRCYFGNLQRDLPGLQTAFLETVLDQQNQQCNFPILGKSGNLNHGYHGNPEFSFDMPYSGNPRSNRILPSVGSGTPTFQNERIPHAISTLRSSIGGYRDGGFHQDC